MLEKLMQYITTKYMKFDNGTITFGKEKVTIYFLSQLANEFLLNYKVCGMDYCAAMFLEGKEQGKTFVKTHGLPLKKVLTPIVGFALEILGTFGFGTFRTLKVDSKNGFMVIAGKSSIASEIKRKGKSIGIPIDFMLSWLFAGALETFSGRKMYCIETKCVANKDVEECIWVVGDRTGINKYIKEFSPESKSLSKKVLDAIKAVEDKGVLD